MSSTLRRSLAATLLVLAAACAAAPPFDARAVAAEWAAYMQRDYVLRAGDRLAVRVDSKALAVEGEVRDNVQEVIVSPSGSIDLRRLPGPLQVSGKSVGATRTMILEAYRQAFTDVTVSVTLTEAATQSIYVCGEVSRPGPQPFQPGMTMTQAISSAGSFTILVKHSDIRILRINPDGSQRTFRVNMDAVLLEESPDFLLLPGDVVYAQTSTIADLGNLVELYVRRLLPFDLGGPTVGSYQ